MDFEVKRHALLRYDLKQVTWPLSFSVKLESYYHISPTNLTLLLEATNNYAQVVYNL